MENGLLRMVLESTARHWVGFAAAWLVGHGMLTQADEGSFIRIGAGVAIGLAMWGWSLYQKVDHAATVGMLKDRLLGRR
jgi:F0F1-type ATP synthase membrane subunit c/vacuolar-type H+-ATPase subunit K